MSTGDVSQEVVKEQFKTLKNIVSSVKDENLEDVKKYMGLLPSVNEFQIKAVPTMLNEALSRSISKKNFEITCILLKDERVGVFKKPIFGFSPFVDICKSGWCEIISVVFEIEKELDQEQVNKGLEMSCKSKNKLMVLEILKDKRVEVSNEVLPLVKEIEVDGT